MDPQRVLGEERLDEWRRMEEVIAKPQEDWVEESRALLISEEEEHKLRLRLLRNQMGKLMRASDLLRDKKGNVLAAGLMAVDATPPWQRLIQDRRPQNGTEKGLDWARLCRGSQLCRMSLRPQETARGRGEDVNTYFYEVISLPTQHKRNAVGRPIQGGDPEYVEWGATGVGEQYFLVLVVEGMGDLNAVSRTQECHEALLRKFDDLDEGRTLRYRQAFP